jgi:hypothetical protein
MTVFNYLGIDTAEAFAGWYQALREVLDARADEPGVARAIAFLANGGSLLIAPDQAAALVRVSTETEVTLLGVKVRVHAGLPPGCIVAVARSDEPPQLYRPGRGWDVLHPTHIGGVYEPLP